MKIIVPIESGKIANQFEYCDQFGIFEIDGNLKITNIDVVENNFKYEKYSLTIKDLIESSEIKLIIAKKMTYEIESKCYLNGVQVISNNNDDIFESIYDYLNNK